jgi:hypothetical protein
MADRLERRLDLAGRFPEAKQALLQDAPNRRFYAWEEPDGARRAYAVYVYSEEGGWQSGGDASCG